MKIINKLILVLIITLLTFSAKAACKFELEFGDDASKVIDKFIKNLEDLKKAIETEDEKKLEAIFIKTKRIRKDIIEAGQDVKKPDFGRK